MAIFYTLDQGSGTYVVRLGKHVHSEQRKTTPTQILQFHIIFMCMLC